MVFVNHNANLERWLRKGQKMNTLIEKLRSAKNDLALAKAKVLEAEIALYKEYQDKIPEEGSFKVDDLTIKTGFYPKWDQESLAIAEQAFPKSEPFPFSMEYKPDNKALSYLKEHKPMLYEKIAVALSLTQKKPAFTLKGMKDE
jgi:hypothetical protein